MGVSTKTKSACLTFSCRNEHYTVKTSMKKGESYFCGKCDYTGDNRDSVKKHVMLNHTPGVRFQCQTCQLVSTPVIEFLALCSFRQSHIRCWEHFSSLFYVQFFKRVQNLRVHVIAVHTPLVPVVQLARVRALVPEKEGHWLSLMAEKDDLNWLYRHDRRTRVRLQLQCETGWANGLLISLCQD